MVSSLRMATDRTACLRALLTLCLRYFIAVCIFSFYLYPSTVALVAFFNRALWLSGEQASRRHFSRLSRVFFSISLSVRIFRTNMLFLLWFVVVYLM